MAYEYASSRFITEAREARKAGRTVYVLTRNVSAPSYDEIAYEEARREGVLFIHLEEGEDVVFGDDAVALPARALTLPVDEVVRLDDYADAFRGKEFLSAFRSEPQLRWSPTKWARTRYHVGFVRHPRAARWEPREVLGAAGEMLLDEDGDRVLPEINEERCSGCGSCRDACPHDAIEIEMRTRSVALFGPDTEVAVPVAHVKADACVGCGLCASTCPSDVITHAG
jgi:NAD-dependent dihydropyrimidine dehydrogenase PreA subunit